MKGHAADVVKRFRGFNEDFGYWEAEPGAVGIVSSVGMLPPATVTSLQHSFPQSWNNRDPHHTPHLLFTLSHTFLPQSSVGLTHIDQESFMQHLDSCSILLFDSLEGARPLKNLLWKSTIFLLISRPDIALTHSGGEQQTQQNSFFFIALSDIITAPLCSQYTNVFSCTMP